MPSEEETIDRVLLVSPPGPAVLAGHPEIAAFARVVRTDEQPRW